MTFNKLIQTFVGADLSRPAPIYRPSVHVLLSGRLILLNLIIAPLHPFPFVISSQNQLSGDADHNNNQAN